MTIYLIKVLLSSAVFLLAYKLLLENTKMLVFNRFYLLFSLIISLLIPKINIETEEISTILPIVALPEKTNITEFHNISNPTIDTEYISTNTYILIAYFIIVFMLSVRFTTNLKKLLTLIKLNKKITYEESEIVLIKENITPHSFLNYIFLNQKEYTQNAIEPEILIHELSHVRQKHSYDVLFIEIFQIIFWFNPFIILFRKAIQMNHEFLADAAVINSSNNLKRYQHLILAKVSNTNKINLTSQFNYSITKQRLIMMTQTNSKKKVLLRVMALIPIIAITMYTFSTKTIAQNTKLSEKSKEKKVNASKLDLATEEEMQEFEKIAEKLTGQEDITRTSIITVEQKNRLGDIFMKMNKAQMEKQKMRIMLNKPLPRISPTEQEMKLWLDKNKYGVWINDKRVSNSVLKNYKNDDIAQVFVSKLSKNAFNYGNHYFQVDLMTKPYYETYINEFAATGEKYIFWLKM